MSTRRAFVLLMGLFLLTRQATLAQSETQAVEFYGGHKVVAREVIVKFKNASERAENETAEERAAVSDVGANLDIEGNRRIGLSGARVFRSRSNDVGTMLRYLAARGDVLYVHPNYIVHPIPLQGGALSEFEPIDPCTGCDPGDPGDPWEPPPPDPPPPGSSLTIPNDNYFSFQWALRNTGQQSPSGVTGTAGADISATKAWDLLTGSSNVVVAIIDNGFDYTHPELTPNFWSASRSFTVFLGTGQLTCAAGTHGFNNLDTANPNSRCDPFTFVAPHGTNMAGIVGAVGNDSRGHQRRQLAHIGHGAESLEQCGVGC